MEIENSKKNNKRILLTVTLILLLIISVTGATFAYFAISATNSATVTGTAAQVGLTLEVAEAPLGGSSSGATKTNVMVPQLASAIGSAIGNNYKCVDANGNTVCKVYTITITNNSTAAVDVNGTIAFVSATNGKEIGTNLKWRRIQSPTTLSSTTTGSYAQSGVAASTATTDLTSGTACTVGTNCQSITIPAEDSQTYYIVIWINEITTGDQYDVDGNRTFTGTITFTASNGEGVTSTITS